MTQTPSNPPRLGRRAFTGGLLATAAGGALSGCMSTNPATGRSTFTGFYSLEDEVEMGREEHPKLVEQFGGAYEDPKLTPYVKEIGQRLARHTEFRDLPYRVTLLNSPVVNAFALPGGFVYVTRGLLALADTEAEMAGVVAHELGHVNARHVAERLSRGMVAQLGLAVLGAAVDNRSLMQAARFGAGAYIRGFSRQQEFEADELGVRYMSRAGYDPEAMVSFLRTLRAHSRVEARMMGLPEGSVDDFNIMATHPRTVERVRAAMQAAGEAPAAAARQGREDYLDRIDGMLYGDDPRQGLVLGRRFVHPGLRLAFEVPAGFRLRNTPDRVVARHADGAAIVFDMAPMPARADPARWLRDDWARGLRLRGLERIEIDGMAAATAHARVQADGGVRDLRLVAARHPEREQALRFMFLTTPGQTAALSEPLRRTTYSLRRLSRSEAEAVKPMRLLAVRARPGDTVEALARPLPFEEHDAEIFRLLNDLDPGQPLPRDRRIKVIAGGGGTQGMAV